MLLSAENFQCVDAAKGRRRETNRARIEVPPDRLSIGATLAFSDVRDVEMVRRFLDSVKHNFVRGGDSGAAALVFRLRYLKCETACRHRLRGI